MWSFGGKWFITPFSHAPWHPSLTEFSFRITRSMGEAFKLHSESLFGYDDAVAAGTNISTPTMSSAGVGVGDLEMQNVEHVY